MSRSRRAANGFLTSLIQYSSIILMQGLLVPVVLRLAGRETLGAYAAVMQVVGLLGLVDIAGSWCLERFLAQSVGIDDKGVRFRNIFTTAKTLLFATNLLFAILVIIFSAFIGKLFHLTPSVVCQAQYALYIIAIWAIVRTPLTAYNSASIATQDLAAVNIIGTLIVVLRSATSLVFVLAGGGLFGLMFSGTLVEACGTVLYRIRFKKVSPHLMPGWGIPNKSLLWEMVGFGAHALFINIGNLLIFTSGTAIAGFTSGAGAASAFYTTQMPTMIAYMIVLRLSDSATPAIHELYGQQDMQRVKSSFLRLTRYLLLLAMPLAVGEILFNRDLVFCWVGPAQYAGSLLTYTLGIFCLLIVLQRVAQIFTFAFGWMHGLAVTAFLQGITNLGLAAYLAKRIGLGGITLALVLVISPQIVVLWFRLGRFFKLNPSRLILGIMARFSLPLGFASALGMLVHSLITIQPHHSRGFIAETCTFTVTYALMVYPLLVGEDRLDLSRHLETLLSSFHLLLRRGAGSFHEII